jgi:hypothetical protein
LTGLPEDPSSFLLFITGEESYAFILLRYAGNISISISSAMWIIVRMLRSKIAKLKKNYSVTYRAYCTAKENAVNSNILYDLEHFNAHPA